MAEENARGVPSRAADLLEKRVKDATRTESICEVRRMVRVTTTLCGRHFV